MRVQKLSHIITHINRPSAVRSELVGGGAPDADGRIAACHYGDGVEQAGEVEGGATWRIRGMEEKVPSEGMPVESWRERVWRRRLGTEDIVPGGVLGWAEGLLNIRG